MSPIDQSALKKPSSPAKPSTKPGTLVRRSLQPTRPKPAQPSKRPGTILTFTEPNQDSLTGK